MAVFEDLLTPAATLLVGISLRVISLVVEVRHVRFAWDHFFRHGSEPSHGHEVLLSRTATALAAAKLLRVTSVLFVAPSALALTLALVGPLFGAQSEILRLAVTALTIIAFYFLVQAWLMRQFHQTARKSTVGTEPEWLLDEMSEPPAPLMAGGLLWDWLMRLSSVPFKPFNLIRPAAQLVQQDDTLQLVIGGTPAEPSSEPQEALPGLARTERDMIRAIQRLDDTLAREVMRPLNNVTAVSLSNLTTERFLDLARRTGYTRFPCYNDQITNLIGYLNVHDFLETPVAPRDPRNLVRDALYLPEVARVDRALQEMLRTKAQLAICYDEYGGCSGVLSREDIIEEITGEIMDEYDRPVLKIEKVSSYWIVDGSTDLDDLEEAIDLQLPKDNCDTIAGYILHRLSRTPRRGERIDVSGWLLEVVRMEKHRIRRIRVVPPTSEEDQDSE